MSSLKNEIRWNLCACRIARDYERSPDKGLSFGPRDIEFALNNVWQTDSPYHAGPRAWLFSFGAYGDCHIVAFGSLEEALEDAAALLAPGYFYEPDFAQARHELREEGMLDDSDEDLDRVFEHATTDLTYTESGWLISHEWTVREVIVEDVYAFAKGQ